MLKSVLLGTVILTLGIYQVNSAPRSSIEPDNEDNWRAAIQIPKNMRGTWCPTAADGQSVRFVHPETKTNPACKDTSPADTEPFTWISITEDGWSGPETKEFYAWSCKVIDRKPIKATKDQDAGFEFKARCKSRVKTWTQSLKMWALRSSHNIPMLDIVGDL
jgi:hypothetical protein